MSEGATAVGPPSRVCSRDAPNAPSFVRIICVEESATDGSKGRRCKRDETQNTAGPSKAQDIRIANWGPSAPPAQPDDVHLTQVWEAIFDIMGVYWRSVGVTQMIQELRKRYEGGQSATVLDCAEHPCPSWLD